MGWVEVVKKITTHILPAPPRHDVGGAGQFLKLDARKRPVDPYAITIIAPQGEAEGDADAITDGTGVIRIYQDLIFRREADPQFQQNRRQLLLQYCELDTAAMVMIWKRWSSG